jgi:DNA mismatch repair protein MutS2
MNDAVLRKLEFPEILDRLARQCRFDVAAGLARGLRPGIEVADVEGLLNLTGEAVDLLTNFPDVSIGGARDIRLLVERAAKGGRLQPAELLLVLDMVSAGRTLRRSFGRLPVAEQRFPVLLEIVDRIADAADLEADINRTVGPRGDVLDTASDALRRIRREVRVAHSRLMDRLNSLISSGRYATAIQDAIITTRDGRYVIPIKSEARAQVPGVVHDTSASGQTLFIEPLDVVELNNRWREQQLAEQHEIELILDIVSATIGATAASLSASVAAVAEVDLAMAKARLAFQQRATRPRLWTSEQGTTSENGHRRHRIALVRARHPLLDPAEVVPIDITLGDQFRVLLITGPNTGGKTVALKTVGLLQVMAQAGLFIPADDESTVSVFPSVFADIGDEQSIAQSLSTFSAHMRTVIWMLRHVSDDSLVLLDELGAGTDPQEGSALARSLISTLLDRNALVIATTHYSEVKAYAYATSGVENASVEFDLKTLAPTYRLMIGVPGRSNALAIARRLGMPRDIVEAASAYLDPDDLRADALLQDIRTRRDEIDAVMARARETEHEARQLRLLAARQLRDAEQVRREVHADSLAAAESELAEVRDTLKRLQRDRETVSATREHVEGRRKEVERAADVVRTFRRERVVRPSAPAGGAQAHPIRPGDQVRIVALGQDGEVAAVSDGQADVLLGSLKLRQPLDALQRLGRVKPTQLERAIVKPAGPGFVPIEIDLRGQRVADIEGMLDRYVEDAYRSGLPWVRIIHGKGTGALRKVVGDLLRGHPAVARYELAPLEQGGDGATVATMREG